MNSRRLDEILNTIGSERAEHLLKYLTPEKIVELYGSIDLDALVRGDFDLGFDEEHKSFSPYLADSIFIRPFQLYGKYGKALEANHEYCNATLYFIAKRKKMRFILDETDFEDDFLKFSISIADEKTVTHKLSIVRLLTGQDMPELKKLLVFPVSTLSDLKSLQLEHAPYPITGISIDKSNSDENILVFTLYAPDGQQIEQIAFPHSLVSLLDADLDDISEVLYIGQSRKMKQRALSHEKIQQALSETGDKEDIYLFFFIVIDKVIFWNSYDSNAPNATEITDQGRLNLVEMSLINYFKPKYNETFKNSKIPLNKQVNELLKMNNYTRIVAESSFDSTFWKFGSGVVKPKQHHAAVYKLDL